METLRKNGTKVLHFLSKDVNFYTLLILESILFNWLHSENIVMYAILPYYEDFLNYFMSGFDDSYVFKSETDTFPMWGYGFVLLLPKWLIILIQHLIALYTIHKTQELLKDLSFPKPTISWLRLFLIIGFSWFIFHTVLWPYSIAANLLILSLLFLSKGYYTDTFKYYIISALLLGVTLNFRSDYLYYFYALALLLVVHHIFIKKRKHLFSLSWIGLVLLMLVPWGMYTHHKTGHYLLNSTNGGHVLYISLGQLPNNIWGIVPDDLDPKMRATVDEQLGQNVSTLSLASDKMLKQAWKENIKNDPAEYLKKCFYNLYSTIIRPFSTGQIYSKFIPDMEEMDVLRDDLKKDVSEFNFISLLSKFTSKKYIGFLIPVILNIVSVFCFLFFLASLLIGLFKYRKAIFLDWFLLTIYSVVGYQLALQTLAFYNPNYHTNVYMFYAILAAMIASRLPVNFMDKKQNIVISTD